MKRPASAHEEMCPACQRVQDKYPAGYLTLGGQFLQAHKEEILNLVRNEEQDENAEHPLHRVMQIEEGTEGIVVTTTDLHLPRRIGEALHRAYQGEIDFHYIEEGSILCVQWTREVYASAPSYGSAARLRYASSQVLAYAARPVPAA